MCQDLGDKVHASAETCQAAPRAPARHPALDVASPAGGARSTVDSSEVAAGARDASLADTATPLMRTVVVPVLPLGYGLLHPQAQAVSCATSCDGAVQGTSHSCVGCCRHCVLFEAAPEHLEGAPEREAARVAGGGVPLPTCGLWHHWRPPAFQADQKAAPTMAEAWQLCDALEREQAASARSAQPAPTSGAALLVRPDGYVAWRHRGDPCALTPSCPPLIRLARILQGPGLDPAD